MRDKTVAILFGTSALAGYLFPTAFADQPSAPTAELQEVVVTATKRQENINSVPMSVTAVTGAQLAHLGISSPNDLETVVPGFTYQKDRNGVPIYYIRGIGFYDDAIGGTPAVSVYLDQAPIPFSIEAQGVGFDVERVEVMKGPQGTLFGENTTGGAVNYIPNKPKDKLDGGVGLTYGNFNTVNADGYITGPISDTIDTRLALQTEQRFSGWQQSYTRNATLGKRDFATGRWLTDWTPSDSLNFELDVNGWINHSDTEADQYIAYAAAVPPPRGEPEQAAILPPYPRAAANDRAADWNADELLKHHDGFFMTSLQGNWIVSSSLTLTSMSTYTYASINSGYDQDGTAFDDFFKTSTGLLRSGSEELRLAGEIRKLQYMLGGVYENQTTRENDFGQNIASNSGIGPFRYYDFLTINNQDVHTKAAFGSLNYHLTRQLRLSGSARYTDQDRAFRGCLSDSGDGEIARAFGIVLSSAHVPLPAGQCVTFLPTGQPGLVHSHLNQDNVSWRGALSWQVAEHNLIYGSVARGFKAGAYDTLPAVFSVQFQPVTQESVLAYEAGFKSLSFDNKLSIDGALFYDDYKDKQISGYVPVPLFGQLPALVSVPRSSVKGAELDVTMLPLNGLRLTVDATYVASRVDAKYMTSDPFSNVINIQGEQFPNTPKWQISGDAEYTFAVSDTWRAFLGANEYYRAHSYAAFGDNPTYLISGYALLGLRAGVESLDGKWRVQLWGHNITDKYYWLNAVHVVDVVDRTAGMPATYGVTVSRHF